MPSGSSGVAEIEVHLRSEAEELDRLEALANLLDSRFVIPGTDVRFGLDSVLGLVPVLGDAIAAIVSLYIVTRLADLGVSRWVRARMLVNVLLDFGVGSVPVVGDILDVAYKVNMRNIALARRNLGKNKRRR